MALAAPVLDASLGPDVPLRPEEVAAVKRHLRFLRQHKKALGLRLNAEEDLLCNGVREPSHRGVVMALLSKVDHVMVTRALERIDDAAQRTELLAGVARFSDDLGILLLYLESLADSASRAKAAGAFSLAVARMDLSAASEARVTRLLQVLAQVFQGHERAQALFGLMHAPGFAAMFDAVRGQLPPDLQQVIVPLAAVYEEVVLGQETRHGSKALRDGCVLLLTAPSETLVAYPFEVRVRLLETAVALVPDDRTADRAAAALLESLPPTSDEFVHLSLLRAGELMRRHADERAEWLLRRLEGARADCTDAALWRDALAGKRHGRFALGWPAEGGRRLAVPETPDARGFLPAFSLDAQVPVWLRSAPKKAKDAFGEELRLHRDLVLPGVAPVVGADPKHLSVAVPAWGRAGKEALPALAADRRAALELSLQAVSILGGLAHAGVRLPDARAWRFLVDDRTDPPRLWVADLSGARSQEGVEIRKAHGGLGRGLTRELLEAHEATLPPPLRRLLLRRRPRLDHLQLALADALERR